MKKSSQMLQTVKDQKNRLFNSSLFVKTWLILLLLFFSVTTVFVLTVNRVENTHRRQIACQTNLELLSGASEIAELGLQNTRADLGAVIWNTDVTNYFMDPERRDTQRQYRIMQMFSRMQRANDWIRSMWISSLLSEEVLTMDGELVDGAEFPDHEVLDLLSGSARPSNPDDPSLNAELVLYEGRLFWVEPFVTNKPVGCLCIEVDMDVLFARISGKTADDIGLFDVQGNRIAPEDAESGLPQQAVLSDSGQFVTETEQDPRKAAYYLVENEPLHLVFLKAIDRSAFELPVSATLRAALPIVLLLAAAVLLASYFLAAGIYRPINYLVRQVLSHATDRESSGTFRNEVDYLELSYFRAMRQNEAMKGRLEHFSRDIQEQVFRKLLQGRTEEEAGVAYLDETVLQSWQNGRKMCVIACRRKGTWNVPDSYLDSQLFHVTVAGALESTEALACQTVSMGICLEAVMLSAGGEESVNSLRQKIRSLEQKLQEVFRPSDCEIITGEGSFVTERDRLAASWEEALHKADYQVYLEGAGKVQESETDAGETEARAYYRERWNRILQQVISGNREKAEAAVGEYMDAFWQGSPAVDEIVVFFRQSMSALTEQLLTEYNIRISSVPVLEGEQIAVMSSAEQKKWIRYQLDSVLQQALTYMQRKSNRYVVDAMNYIRDHYDNRDLSVQDVADHLGITSNYFSTLFHESTGSSFIAYLNQVRVEQAGYLLKETRIPIGDIGFRCGFNTVQHFNRTFKKIVGMPPSQYRSENS